ncbi:DUF1835 domain-containing protein [Paenibacillus solani]|uniref:DUF1835 domain-containing protein n=1 Tax=Paenibacillus solani TaxID=1705565 RepID=A0A0M1P435_9BACL|nr:DUF1835 domain-containing protein [Paenibacillus solani]KOR89167.1 hypothetical protein AM231_08325 [Paenibacillus solani]
MHHAAGEVWGEQQASESMYRLLEEEIESVYKQQMQAEELQTHVHVVFGLSDAGSLKVVLSRLGKREENKVLAFNDVFSVGPITDLHTTEGQQHRQMWLMEHDKDSFYGNLVNQEHQIMRMIEKLRNIQENKTVVIWFADNAHDQTGLRFALFLLRERKAPVHIVNLTKILEETGSYGEKGKAPFAQSLIEYEKYLDIVRDYGNGFLLDANQREQYVSEWIELAGQDHLIRLWEQGKVIGGDENQLDEVIIQSVIEMQEGVAADDFVKAGEVLERVMENSQQLISYSYIINRIWSLVNDGHLIFKGIPNMMHQFSVRISKGSFLA